MKKGSVKDNGTTPSQLYTLALLSFLCLCGLPVFDRKSLSMVLLAVNPHLDSSTQITIGDEKGGCWFEPYLLPAQTHMRSKGIVCYVAESVFIWEKNGLMSKKKHLFQFVLALARLLIAQVL